MKNILYLFVLIFCLFIVPSVNAEETPVYYDLKAESIAVVPANPAVEQNCIITVKIKNNGTEKLMSSSGLSSYVIDFENFSRQDVSYTYPSFDNIVEAGGYIYYTIEGYFIQSGASSLSFSVNTDRELVEDEIDTEGGYNNNSVSKEITIVDKNANDLEINSIELSSERPVIGQILTITVTVKNQGDTYLTSSNGLGILDINYSFSDFNIDLDKVTRSDYPTIAVPLAPKGTFTYSYSGYFYEQGEKALSFEVDKYNYLTETNEDNNASTTLVTIYKDQESADEFEILSYKIGLLSTTSARVIWKTDRETTGQVNYKKSDTYLFEELNSLIAKTEHQIDIKNLWANINYDFRFVAINGTVSHEIPWQNMTTPRNDNLTLTDALDTNISGSQVSFSWGTNLLSNSYVFYRQVGETYYKSIGSNDLVLSNMVSLTDLEAGDYQYYIKSTSEPNTVYQSIVDTFSIAPEAGDSTEVVEEESTSDTSVSTDQDTSTNSSISGNQNGDTERIMIKNQSMYNNLKGKIVLKVEANGEAYYINPSSQEMYYLGRPDDAFAVMRGQGIGITNNDLEKIPVSLSNLTGQDSDNDGLPDLFEDAIGFDKNKADTDSDGYLDKAEIENGYRSDSQAKFNFDFNFSSSQSGKIFLQVEGNGEAWYINPSDNKRYFLGRPADAFSVMRNLGLGISNSNFEAL